MTQYSNEELDELPTAVKEKVKEFIDLLLIAFNRKYGSDTTTRRPVRQTLGARSSVT
jgi:hypothetical protein